MEHLKRKGPKLFLPNHPANVDAQLMGALSSQYCKISPVVSERFVNMPIVGFFLKKVRAIPVSDLTSGNRDPHVLDKITKNVAISFSNGRCPIVYPSGQIKLQAHEEIKNKQTAHKLVGTIPDDVRIIGVRILGLWGSSWSAYKTGEKPNFGLTFLKSILIIFANLVFFCPKRKVKFEFVDITDEAKEQAKGDRKSFNTYLEEFYNIYGPEEAVQKKLFFFSFK